MIYLVVGARPNFIKISAISRAFNKLGFLDYEIIHTGQHYDYNMNQIFFNELDLKDPYRHLGVGSGPHGQQTGRIMEQFEEICMKEMPDMVFVVGDVNSTVAASLVASKLHVLVVHQEAGMRSFDMSMPEEVNRIVTDHVSNILFPIAPIDKRNLFNEGIKKGVYLVGDPMIDNLLYYSKLIEKKCLNDYFLVELHRPSNVDSYENLSEIFIALNRLSDITNVIFTIHPRTKKKIDEFNLWKLLTKVNCIDPLGYIDFIKYMKCASCVITDSDGIQQETSILNVSCLAIRDTSNVEYTIKYGTTTLSNVSSKEIFNKAMLKFSKSEKNSFPVKLRRLNDGKASDRMVNIIYKYLNK